MQNQEQIAEANLLIYEEDLNHVVFETDRPENGVCMATWCSTEDQTQGIVTYAALLDQVRGQALIDSGASENIVGEDTLQELAQCLAELGFDPAEEIEVDRHVHNNFTYGNNQTNAGLGPWSQPCEYWHLRRAGGGTGAHGGGCHALLAVLHDMDATINFRRGIAVFRRLSERQFQLERSHSNHLLLPMTAFAGREEVLSRIWVADECEVVVKQLSSPQFADIMHSQAVEEGDPPKEQPKEAA